MKLIHWIVSIKFGIEMKTFFVSLTQPDHQRVYPGGVNERISENLWENTKKWRAANSSD